MYNVQAVLKMVKMYIDLHKCLCFIYFIAINFYLVSSENVTRVIEKGDPTVTDIVFMDISINGEVLGRMEIGLFGYIVPKTVKNFVELAKREKGGYNGTKFHRAVRDFMVQGGDVVNGDGTGVTSIYGGPFEDENFKLKHYGRGWVSMANAGKDTNGCQFFITVKKTPWLDGLNVVFGKVIRGWFIVKFIEKTKVDEFDRPTLGVVIENCGIEPVKKLFTVKKDDTSWIDMDF